MSIIEDVIPLACIPPDIEIVVYQEPSSVLPSDAWRHLSPTHFLLLVAPLAHYVVA